MGLGKESRSKSHQHKITIHYTYPNVSGKPVKKCQDNKTPRRDGARRACPIITFLCIDRCNLHFGLPAARRGTVEEFTVFSTIQSDKQCAGQKTRFRWKMQNLFLLSFNFLDEICTCWLFNAGRKPPFPYLSFTVRTGKALEMSVATSVQDV